MSYPIQICPIRDTVCHNLHTICHDVISGRIYLDRIRNSAVIDRLIIDRQSGTSCGYKMAKSIVFNKVRVNLGLDRCKTFVTAAAPLSADIKKFFLSLDIPIMDAFGMSEAAGAHTLSIYPK